MASDETPTKEDGALEEVETVETATGNTEVVEQAQTSTPAQRSFSENFQKFLNESDIHIGNAKGIESGRPNLGFNEFVYTGKNVVSKRLPDFVYNIHKQIFASDVVRGDKAAGVYYDPRLGWVNFGNFGSPVIDVPIGYTGVVYFYVGFNFYNTGIVESCHRKCQVSTQTVTDKNGVLFAFKFENGRIVPPNTNVISPYHFMYIGYMELMGNTFFSNFVVHADGKSPHTHVDTFGYPNGNGITFGFSLYAWRKKTCKRNVCHNTCTCTAHATLEFKVQNAEGAEGKISITKNDRSPQDYGSISSLNSFEGLYASWYNEKVKGGSGSIDAWMKKYDYGYREVPIKAQMGWLSTDVGYIYDSNGNPVGI